MKKTHICSKCNSTDVVRIDGTYNMHGENVIIVGTFKTPVYVNRYLCLNCGFSEEWIDMIDEDIQNLKKKYQ